MSAISRPIHGQGNHTELYVVAVRINRQPDEAGPNGYIYCDGCGGSSMSRTDFADIVGITPNHLQRWLNRRPIRDDIAAAIKRKLLRVEDGDARA